MYLILSYVLALGSAFLIGKKSLLFCVLLISVILYAVERLIKINSIQSPIAYYIWIITLGSLAEGIAAAEFAAKSIATGWILSIPSLWIFMFSKNIPSAKNRILAALFVPVLLILQIFLHANGKMGESIYMVFASVWIGIIFSSIRLLCKGAGEK